MKNFKIKTILTTIILFMSVPLLANAEVAEEKTCDQKKEECLAGCPAPTKEIPDDFISVISGKTIESIGEAIKNDAERAECKMQCDKEASQCQKEAKI